jgi:hypothetical protein
MMELKDELEKHGVHQIPQYKTADGRFDEAAARAEIGCDSSNEGSLANTPREGSQSGRRDMSVERNSPRGIFSLEDDKEMRKLASSHLKNMHQGVVSSRPLDAPFPRPGHPVSTALVLLCSLIRTLARAPLCRASCGTARA